MVNNIEVSLLVGSLAEMYCSSGRSIASESDLEADSEVQFIA